MVSVKLLAMTEPQLSNFEHEPCSQSAEALLVQDVFSVRPRDLAPGSGELAQYEATVAIVEQFSRANPETGEREVISPSRVAAIPAITERHMRLLHPARGELSLSEVRDSWWGNMPENDGLRHPDMLFDMTQMNFGTDEPIGHIEYNIMRAELQRRELMEQFRSMMRHAAAQRRFERPLDDETSEAAIDELIDRMQPR